MLSVTEACSESFIPILNLLRLSQSQNYGYYIFFMLRLLSVKKFFEIKVKNA